MKNYRRRIICGILYLILLLAACSKTSVYESGEKASQNSQKEENVGEIDKDNEKQKSAILNDATELDEDGHMLYVANKRVESALQQEIALYNENLLLWGYGTNSTGETGFQLSLISLQSGEVLQEKTFTGMELANVQVCGEKIAVIDWAFGTVSILDYSFTVLKEVETNTSYCTINLNADATKIYCFTQQGVKVIDIENGDEKILFDHAVMLFASSKCGDTVSVTYTDKETQMNESGIADLTTGIAEKIPYEGAFHSVECNSEIWLVGTMDEDNQYYLGKADRPKTFISHDENAIMTLIANPLRLMSTGYDESGITTLTLYTLDGKFLSQSQLPETVAQVLYEPIWSETDGGYFLTAVDNTGKDVLLFWDMSIPTVGEDLMMESAYQENSEIPSTISNDLLSRAEEIKKKYSVDILIGDQTEEEYETYYVAHEMNTNYITAGLNAIELALEQYPKGFMRQLLYGNQRKLEIHLTGAFSLKEFPSGEVNGFTSYIGLAEEQEDKTVIAVDITMAGSIEQTLHHEIMHVIDNKLAFDANVRENALYSEEAWTSLNPKEFSYVEDTFYLPTEIYNDGYESYFIDVYSRTSAKEDRARIMEYAMSDADWAFSAADGRYNKLDYLCKCIRDAFNTENWPDATEWEKTLNRSR